MSKEDKAKLDNYVGGVTGDTLPIGSIQEWPSNIIPNNWLLCNGQAVSRTDYAELFVVLGTTYGAGDGSTTFNLPDFKGRVTVGKDENDVDFDTLGKTDGEKEHILTIEEMPQHNHGENIVTKYGYQYSLVANNGEGEEKDGYLPTLEGTETNKAQVSTDKTGKNQAHNNLQPYIVTNYIIKTHQSAGVVSEVIQKDGEASTTNVYSADAVKEMIANSNEIVELNVNNLLLNGWIEHLEGCCQIFKKGNIVNINLAFKNGTSAHFLTLPEGFRPSHLMLFPATNNNSGKGTYVSMGTGGEMMISEGFIGNLIFASFSYKV